MPVQRIPRYVLFVKELNKYTPSFHPDHQWAQLAFDTITDLSHYMDKEANKASKEMKINDIQNNLTTKFQITASHRKLIELYNITILEKTNSPATLILMSDIIVLVKNNGKNYTVLYNTPSFSFHYTYLTDQTIKIYLTTTTSLKPVVIQFQSALFMEEFFKNIEETKKQYIQTYKNPFTLNWEALRTSIDFPSTYATASVLYDNTFIFFGGKRTPQKIPASLLTAIRLNELDCVEITAVANGRCGHTLSLTYGVDNFDDKLCIIGGKNKSKNKIFKKILAYNFQRQTWEQLLLNGEESFTPRYGHTTAANGNQFYIFGGKTTNGVLLNDLVIFDPLSTSLKTQTIQGAQPSPRYNHAVVIIDDHLYLHGGKTQKGISNELWMLDLISMSWQQCTVAGEKLPPREGHSMAAFGNSLIIYGGKGNTDLPTYTYDIETFNCQRVLDTGNVPYTLNKAALVYDDNNIYIYGGIEKNTTTPSNVLYKVSLNPKWAELSAVPKPRKNLIPVRREKSVPIQLNTNEPDFDQLAQITKAVKPRIQIQSRKAIRKSLISSTQQLTADDLNDYIDEFDDDGIQLETIKVTLPTKFDDYGMAEEEEEEEDFSYSYSDDLPEEGNLEVFSINPIKNQVKWKPNPATAREKEMASPSHPIMELLDEILDVAPKLPPPIQVNLKRRVGSTRIEQRKLAGTSTRIAPVKQKHQSLAPGKR